MATEYWLSTVKAAVYESSASTGGRPDTPDALIETGDTVEESSRPTKTEIADAVTDQRLDPFVSGTGPEAVEHVAIWVRGAAASTNILTITIGATTDYDITMRTNEDGHAVLLLDIALTRSATVGFWASNSGLSGSSVDVWIMYAGT